MNISHTELVQAAAKWLQSRCPIVITEMSQGEIADAIGFVHGHSILVECKTSMNDFKADLKKPSRRNPDCSVGSLKYYLTPWYLDITDQLDDCWGLLILKGARVKMIKKAQVSPVNHAYEINLLVSAIRRIGNNCPQGISVKCYTYETKCRATLGVEKLPIVLRS